MSQENDSPREILPSVFVLRLLGEVDPDAVVWRTMSHYYTASEVIELIRSGDDSGKQFGADLMRTARDVLEIRASRLLKIEKSR